MAMMVLLTDRLTERQEATDRYPRAAPPYATAASQIDRPTAARSSRDPVCSPRRHLIRESERVKPRKKDKERALPSTRGRDVGTQQHQQQQARQPGRVHERRQGGRPGQAGPAAAGRRRQAAAGRRRGSPLSSGRRPRRGFLSCCCCCCLKKTKNSRRGAAARRRSADAGSRWGRAR